MKTHFGVATDYEYSKTHKRQKLVIRSGQFMNDFEGEALSLPSGGYTVDTRNGRKLRVKCPSPRTEHNYQAVDEAINAAMAGR